MAVDLKCKQSSSSTDSSGADYTLKWSGDLEREKLSELLRDGKVNVDGELELKAGGDWNAINKFTTGDKDAFLNAIEVKGGKGLNVTLMAEGGGNWDTSAGNVEFWCDTVGAGQPELGDRLEPVFATNMMKSSNTTLVSDSDGNTNIEVSLKKCDFDRDGKSITCDLKLTTGSDLKE